MAQAFAQTPTKLPIMTSITPKLHPHKSPSIRLARPADCTAICELIHALAVYEKLEYMVKATPKKLEEHLFGERSAAEAVVAELTEPDKECSMIVGFALFFQNFSTFLCQPGLYLEDFFVKPEYRKQGIGKALIKHLAGIAVARSYGRFEWSVLDWNQPAIDFYQAAGAQVLPDWRICRVTGNALTALAAQSQATSH